MGFTEGLEKGWKAFEEQFEEASENVGQALGCALPWLVVFGVLGLLLLGTCGACMS